MLFVVNHVTVVPENSWGKKYSGFENSFNASMQIVQLRCQCHLFNHHLERDLGGANQSCLKKEAGHSPIGRIKSMDLQTRWFIQMHRWLGQWHSHRNPWRAASQSADVMVSQKRLMLICNFPWTFPWLSEVNNQEQRGLSAKKKGAGKWSCLSPFPYNHQE